MRNKLLLSLLIGGIFLPSCTSIDVKPSDSDLDFKEMPAVWDEAIPLGNGFIGALVWEKDHALRMSLDRTDLWDLRPVEDYPEDEYTFAWVEKQVNDKNYDHVLEKMERIYHQHAAPTKIPGAALEFSLANLGEPKDIRLYLNNALCMVTWPDGTTLKTFVHGSENVGWFLFENLDEEIPISLKTPSYTNDQHGKKTTVNELSLASLGYPKGTIEETDRSIHYHQPGYEDYCYDADIRWEQKGKTLSGVWSLSSSLSGESAQELTEQAMSRGIRKDYASHMEFWNTYWGASSVTLPDPVLQKQYDNEMYKFGAAAREDSCPISLQAVWTADSGNIPPWKGDFHHDLNTELSYWPAYAGNHLQEESGFLNTLWSQRDVYREFTEKYFGCKGLNVPGCCTFDGHQIGGWLMYSRSATTAAWLSHHFYLHWKYSADGEFLKERAYPFVKETAEFLENFTYVNEKGKRVLPLSSSPEMFDNTINAWFKNFTNYDLALVKFNFDAAADMAGVLGLQDEKDHWHRLSSELPAFALDEEGALAIAEGVPYPYSHRHFSNAMAIHPLGLLDMNQGEESQSIITNTIDKFLRLGPDQWTGYSYTWLANLAAKAYDGETAARSLRTFAECFCLPNTFHANGDQSRSGKSQLVYRPFTLEGNFAFAAGIQEMLIQSHTGVIHVFPAIPESWKDVAFSSLRTRGAFLVSARREEGNTSGISIFSEKGGQCRIVLPEGWDESNIIVSGDINGHEISNHILSCETAPGQFLELKSTFL